jgi:hypothetical protein
VGIDRPDDADVPPDKDPDRPANRPPAETRYRQECYDDLRAATEERTDPAARSEPGARSKPAEQPGNGQQAQPGSGWEETAELFRWMWTEYKRRWPPDDHPPVDRSKDPPGSWHGDGGRSLKPTDNARIEAQCDRIANQEREKLTPILRTIESQDPTDT